MKKKLIQMTALALSSLLLFTGCLSTNQPPAESTAPTEATTSNELNLYTARHYDVDKKLIDAFSAETGIKVNVVEGKGEELIERIKTEGATTSADLFMTVDGGILNNAKAADIFEPINDATVLENVPERFRDKDNHWIGLATRARVLVYSKDRVNPSDLSTYEDLADSRWKGKVLTRSSTSLYNQSLVASLIELNGYEATETWAQALVNNFAREPEGNDRDQAKAVVAGIGDVAIMNTYYVGLMLNSDDAEERKVAEQIGVFFPNQDTTGTHTNISGVGMIKGAKNKDNAIKFVQYLTSKEAQEVITNENSEFPVNPQAEKSELLASWGDFKMQEIDYASLGTQNSKAIELMGKVGWK